MLSVTNTLNESSKNKMNEDEGFFKIKDALHGNTSGIEDSVFVSKIVHEVISEYKEQGDDFSSKNDSMIKDIQEEIHRRVIDEMEDERYFNFEGVPKELIKELVNQKTKEQDNDEQF